MTADNAEADVRRLEQRYDEAWGSVDDLLECFDNDAVLATLTMANGVLVHALTDVVVHRSGGWLIAHVRADDLHS